MRVRQERVFQGAAPSACYAVPCTARLRCALLAWARLDVPLQPIVNRDINHPPTHHKLLYLNVLAMRVAALSNPLNVRCIFCKFTLQATELTRTR